MINKDELVSKLKNIGNKSIEKSTELKNKSVKYGKRLIRKKAIENIREKLDFAQKSEKIKILKERQINCPGRKAGSLGKSKNKPERRRQQRFSSSSKGSR